MVPSRQRAHAARLGHAAAQLAAGRPVWATPDILPVEAWLTREVERCASAAGDTLPRLLSPAEEWLLWRQCTAQATQDMELLDRGALAESLRKARALAADFHLEPTPQPGAGAEAELLGRVQQAMAQRCRLLGAATLQSLAGALPSARQGAPVAFSGFLRLPPRLASLAGVPAPEPQALVRPQAVIAMDEFDELERIAQWCRRQIARQPQARILVILPSGAGSRERLATLIRQAVEPRLWLEGAGLEGDARSEGLVAIEGGGPLERVPVVAHALATLAWLGGARGDFESVSEWLRAPYWEAPHEVSRARIDLWLRERGQTSLEILDWSEIVRAAPAPVATPAKELAKQLRSAAGALGSGAASPRVWSERFRAALHEVRWPGQRARGSREQQTVVRFHELLDEFGQLSSSAPSMLREEAIHCLAGLADRTAFRPADADAVVTISPALADPVVCYDAIWVAGLHAGAFPQPVQPDPFLPLAMQVARAIPHASAAGRLAEAGALLSAWRAAADELVLSAPGRAQDLELLPSPLLAQWLGGSATATPTRAPAWLAARIHRPDLLESIEDAGLPWPAGGTLPSGTRSLELQNRCAFRAYAELRLGSTQLGAPEPGVGADVRGQLLHAALQRLWQELKDSRALALHTDSMLATIIAQSVAHAAADILGPGASDSPGSTRSALFARECRRAVRLIGKLCSLERERAPFRVQDTELDTTLSLCGSRMRLRIDRIDALEDGGRAILDYKSGRRTTGDWYAARPSHPQLLAYLAAAGQDVVAMATVNVTAREVRFDGVAHAEQVLPRVRAVTAPAGIDSHEAWELHRREWLACIERLAGEFLAGRAAVDPKPHACDYCHVVGICRICERAVDAAADAAEGTDSSDSAESIDAAASSDGLEAINGDTDLGTPDG